MIVVRLAREAQRAGDAPQVAREHADVGGLDRGADARAHRDPEVGLGERGGVVDAVADHRDPLPGGLQARHLRDLPGGAHLGEHAGDADLCGDRGRGAGVVAR